MDHHIAMCRETDFETLSVQEERIVQLIAEGKSNKEIAAQLDYTEGTVKNYISRIFQKTGCSDRTRLAVFALKRNIT
jgi:DNA-binding NarL/FixJ family response regulator